MELNLDGSFLFCKILKMNLKFSNLNSLEPDATNILNVGIPAQQDLCGFNHKTRPMLKSKSENEFGRILVAKSSIVS